MKFSGEKCPVCDNIFSEKDDVVVCPECGTPHHRSCYAVKNVCANAILHGVQGFEWANQSKPEQITDEENFEKPKNFENLKESESPENTVFGVSKKELAAYMLIMPGTREYKEKIDNVKIVNLNILAGALSPFYQFYKGMRMLGIFSVLLFAVSNTWIFSVALLLVLLLFNDYIYLRHAAFKIKSFRRYFSSLPAEYRSDTDYYRLLRAKGMPSVLRGVVEPIAAYYLVMAVITYFSGSGL